MARRALCLTPAVAEPAAHGQCSRPARRSLPVRPPAGGVPTRAVLELERGDDARRGAPPNAPLRPSGLGRRVRPQPDRPAHALPRRRLVRRLPRRHRRRQGARARRVALRRGQVAQRLQRRQRAAGRRVFPTARPARPPRRRAAAHRRHDPRRACRRVAGLPVDRPARARVVQRHVLPQPARPRRDAALSRRRLRAVPRPLRRGVWAKHQGAVHRRAVRALPRQHPRWRGAVRRRGARSI